MNCQKKAVKRVKFDKKKFFVLQGVGLVIGFLNGFLGGGGGILCVPALERFLGLEKKKSHATAMLVMLPLSIVSSFIYVLNRTIENLPLIYIGLSVIVGGLIGAFLFKFIPEKIVGIIFAGLMILAGVRMII